MTELYFSNYETHLEKKYFQFLYMTFGRKKFKTETTFLQLYYIAYVIIKEIYKKLNIMQNAHTLNECMHTFSVNKQGLVQGNDESLPYRLESSG